jgi:tRNA pseudouridine38-40 synthase
MNKRFNIRLAYHGGKFSGWQRQPNAPSVQQQIEEDLSKLYGNTPISVVGCGRTDAGVHAQDFVLHVDLPEETDTEYLCFKLNRMLPDSIVIFEVHEAEADFHARFQATSRTYRYFVHREKDPFANDKSWHVPVDFDIEKMNEAAKYLIGKKDFTSLSKLHTDVATNICEVTKAEWHKVDDTHYYFEISANRFLRNMVRATVGTLMDVGQGKIEPGKITAILDAMDRQAASTSVPAHGLFLWEIEY